MKKARNLPVVQAIDLSSAFVVSNPVSTPLTSLLFSRDKNYSYTKDIKVRKKVKNLSNTDRSGGKKEGADAPEFEKSTFSYVLNNMEIFSKATAVSGTTMAIVGEAKKALTDEVNDRLLELKGDMEYAFINGVMKDEDSGGGRQMSGLLNMVDPANIVDANGEDLTDTLIVDAVEKLFNAKTNNGELFLFVNGTLKRKISAIYKDATNATINLVPGNEKVGISVSQIITDFGVLNVVISTDMPVSTVLICNLDYVEVPELRKPQYKELAKTGDSTKGQVVAENTIITYPKAVAKIVNIK